MELMNTRLFLKNLGADNYRITGLAACCDTVILSDYKEPFSKVIELKHEDRDVRTVFVSMRNFEAALFTLRAVVLQAASSPFVVVIGSEDVTFPAQLDKRFKRYSSGAIQTIVELLTHLSFLTTTMRTYDIR